MSLQKIYADKTISMTDLKRGDMSFMDGLDAPIAVLKRDQIKGYLIPNKLMAYFMDHLEDMDLIDVVNQRLDDIESGKSSTIKVSIDEL